MGVLRLRIEYNVSTELKSADRWRWVDAETWSGSVSTSPRCKNKGGYLVVFFMDDLIDHECH